MQVNNKMSTIEIVDIETQIEEMFSNADDLLINL